MNDWQKMVLFGALLVQGLALIAVMHMYTRSAKQVILFRMSLFHLMRDKEVAEFVLPGDVEEDESKDLIVFRQPGHIPGVVPRGPVIATVVRRKAT